MAESEETRVTDAEVERVAKAIHKTWCLLPECQEPTGQNPRDQRAARAALEAAAALHPPREGRSDEEWGSLRRELDSVAEERDSALRAMDAAKAKVDTTEAALATTIEQRDQAEHQAAAAEAALADAQRELAGNHWMRTGHPLTEQAEWRINGLRAYADGMEPATFGAILDRLEDLVRMLGFDAEHANDILGQAEAALAESRGEVERLRAALMEIAGLHYGVTRGMARTALERGGI